jgi:auxin efflux carrier family protein
MALTGLGESFLAAVQASLSVLLVIFYGGVAAWLNLLTPANTKAISKVCVRMFLPALLFTKIGSELHTGSAMRYFTIFVWAIICHLVSFLVGIVAHLYLGMPDWTTAALMFNNTTSYPLLLIAALDQTGILKSLIVTDETTREAIERAKSYFLVFATISSCLTFAVGPRLIDSEHAADDEHEDKSVPQETSPFFQDQDNDVDPNEETGLLQPGGPFSQRHRSFSQRSFFPSTRGASPAISRRPSYSHLQHRRPTLVPEHKWLEFGPRSKWWYEFISDFFNAPLLGAILGVSLTRASIKPRTLVQLSYTNDCSLLLRVH